jgi:hypothetical protein
MNYPLDYPDYLFAVVTHIFLANRGSKTFRKEEVRNQLIASTYEPMVHNSFGTYRLLMGWVEIKSQGYP